MWLKCEKDLWGGVIGWGGGKVLQAVLAQQGLACEFMRLADFAGKGPGEEVLLLLHHNAHWVPAWAPSFHGPYSSRPWLPKEAHEGSSQAYKDAANKHGWHLDITTRAAGDCLFHGMVVFRDLMAKSHLERRKPTKPLRATTASTAEMDLVPLKDLQDHGEPQEELCLTPPT